MENHVPSILAINPGTRYLGMAAFRGRELEDWRLKVIRGADPPAKLRRTRLTVEAWMRRYQPRYLAIKRLHPSRSSPALKRLAAMISRSAVRRGLNVRQYSIDEVESLLASGAKINKRGIGELIASAYPVLFHELNRERASRNTYHIRMFEAVALGLVCSLALDRTTISNLGRSGCQCTPIGRKVS